MSDEIDIVQGTDVPHDQLIQSETGTTVTTGTTGPSNDLYQTNTTTTTFESETSSGTTVTTGTTGPSVDLNSSTSTMTTMTTDQDSVETSTGTIDLAGSETTYTTPESGDENRYYDTQSTQMPQLPDHYLGDRRVKPEGVGIDGGYPITSGSKTITPRTLVPAHHFEGAIKTYSGYVRSLQDPNKKDKFLKNSAEHFIQDQNDTSPYSKSATWAATPNTGVAGGTFLVPKFSGSATLVNPDTGFPESKEKQHIIDVGYGNASDEIAAEVNGDQISIAPVSPFYPFTRMKPDMARYTTLVSYNRSHIPVADVEFRKAHRHVFISRPECYICCVGGGLSDQAAHDEDFTSVYSRMPYILQMLSPCYVAPFFTGDGLTSNWNFLLTNRITNFSPGNVDLSVSENSTKSIRGYTVTTPSSNLSITGGTLDLQFRDTKYMEVSEMIRMWMLYMANRHYGIFSPPYNGYQRVNGFPSNGGNPFNVSASADYSKLHPYDRAIEFPCTIFDVLTNESDTLILNICAYIGAYPVSLNRSMSNDANAPITKMDVSSTFHYQAKIENRNTSMIMFNYNTGLTNSIGRVTNSMLKESLPFLLKHEKQDIDGVSRVLSNYIGAAGMFTGSPYIVLGKTQKNPLAAPKTEVSDANMMYAAYLKFMPLRVEALNKLANMGIVSTKSQTSGEVAEVQLDTYQKTISPDIKEATELGATEDTAVALVKKMVNGLNDANVKHSAGVTQEERNKAGLDLISEGWNTIKNTFTTGAGIYDTIREGVQIAEEGADKVVDTVKGTVAYKTAEGIYNAFN